MAKNLLVLKGKALWAKVFEPDTRFDSDGVYSIDLLVPEDEAAAMCEQLEGIVQEEFKKAVKKKPALKNDLSTQFPFAPEYDDETGDATGNIKFRVKAKAKITTRDGKTFTQSVAVVDAKRTPMDGSVLVGNGSTVKVAFEAAPYTMMSTKKSGASLRLKAVQVIDLVEHGSTPTSIFDEEDGFESQTTAKSEASSVFEEEVATDDDDF